MFVFIPCDEKALMVVRGKPILYHLLDKLRKANFIYITYVKEFDGFETQLKRDYPNYNFKIEIVDTPILVKVSCFDIPVLVLDAKEFPTGDILTLWNGENVIFQNEYGQPVAWGYQSWKKMNDANSTVCQINTISFKTERDILNIYNLGILFDLDGTLVDTDETYKKTWSDLLGYDVTDRWHEIKGKSDSTVFTQFGIGNKSIEKDKSFQKHYNLNEIPGAISFIKSCQKLDIPCGIVTNCNRTTAEFILNKMGLDLPTTVGDECLKPKPYPDPYIQAKNAKTILVFEDTPTGIQSAKSSGVSCVIGITSSFSADVLKSHGADFCISNFNYDIFDILQMWEECKKKNDLGYLTKECARILDKDVTLEDQYLKGGYIANIRRVFTNSGTYVLKYENENNHLFNKISHELKLYEREYYFYQTLSRHVPLNVPKYFGTIYRDDKQKGVLLEYIKGEFCPEKFDIEVIIKSIANMHKKFLNKTEKFDLMKTIDLDWVSFCNQKWPIFESKWKNVLSKKQMDIGRRILNKFDIIQKRLSEPPLTLVHGDIKIPNIAKVGNEYYFLDWQYILQGKGIQDIAFLLVESFQISDHEKILELYANFMEEDIREYFYDALCYFPFYVAMWFGTVDDKDLIDVSFPKKYVPKLFSIYEYYNL